MTFSCVLLLQNMKAKYFAVYKSSQHSKACIDIALNQSDMYNSSVNVQQETSVLNKGFRF